MMASTSKQSPEVANEATPYTQEHQTVVEKEVECAGGNYDRLKNYMSVPLGTMHWGRVPFELTLERVQVNDDFKVNHKDLILNVNCNNGASDPHWRCTFTVSVQCTFQKHESQESGEQSLTATRYCNSMVIPIMRMPATAQGDSSVTLKIRIKMNSWAGHYAPIVHSFSNKTDLTDATLMVEGRPLYVNRAILALHSTFFYTLFFDNKFPDAAKSEFDLPDVSYDEMVIFLLLIYPNIPNDQHKCIRSIDTIEAMLLLGERFACDSITRLMEKYLMGEMRVEMDGFSLARRLLLSDRFRLSAPCSLLMDKLRRDDALQRLGDEEEYWELSESLRASILDMRMRRSIEDQSPVSPDGSEGDVVDAELERLGMRIRYRGGRKRPVALGPHSTSPFIWNPSPSDAFFADVRRLAAAIDSFAISSSLSDRLEHAVEYLQGLSRSDYDQISPIRRQFIHSHIRNLLDGPQNANYLRAPIATFLTHVEILRNNGALPSSGGPIPRKRMRLRDVILRQ